MNDPLRNGRRLFLLGSGGLASGLILSACAGRGESQGAGSSENPEKAKEVTANEDLMREHGVLRRALLVYHLTAVKLRTGAASSIPAAPLNQTAMLFRRFGEDYHERRLEEPYIFPILARQGGAAATLVNILLAQHERGREITDYIAGTTRGGLTEASAEPLARAMEAMVLMYQEHTAREDTNVFPAWKAALSGAQYDEMNDKFEEIEHQMFGEDGFAEAVKQIAAIEQTLGLADLAQFTAPPPARG